MNHCGASPMIQHVARGMIGAIIVDPKGQEGDAEGLYGRCAGAERFVQDLDDVQGMFDRKYEHVVLNGGSSGTYPVHAKSGGQFLRPSRENACGFIL